MFNMRKIGEKISKLRKANNMTQMELADKMGISFQAVSNWERGNSTPDISKLPELAELFGVTIDEIIGTSSPLVKSAAEGRVEEFLENNEVSAEEIKAAAPLLKPEQLDSIVEKMPIESVENAPEVLPLVSEKFATDVVKHTEAKADVDALLRIAPFVGSDIIDEVAEKWLKEGKEIRKLAPFMSNNMIDKLALEYVESVNIEALKGLAPFVNQKFMDESCKKLYSDGADIRCLLPFVSKGLISELGKKLYRDRGIDGVRSWLPFMASDDIELITNEELGKNGIPGIQPIAPFLSRSFISKIAGEAIAKGDINSIAPILPFVDSKQLSDYVRKNFLQD